MKTRFLILFVLMIAIPSQSFSEEIEKNIESDIPKIGTPIDTIYMTDKDGNILSSAELGDQVFFKLPMNNPFASTKEIDYLFHIIDDGEIIFLKPDTVLLEGGTSTVVIVPWITSDTGILDITFEQFHHNTDTNIAPVIQSTMNIQEIISSPLKQIKSGVALVDVQCSEGKHPAYKYNRMSVACVSEETLNKLWSSGWATMRFYTEEDTSPHALCNNYEGKWHPEHNGCRGDISDLQCSLMGGTFIDNLKICYNDICPENKTYTLCMTDLDEQIPDPAPTSTQCRPGLPPFTSDFYLDKELCTWKLIPEPIPDEAITYVWNGYLQKMQIDFSPKERSYFNFGEGFNPEKENRVCSPLILFNGSETYISSTFTVEPFEMIDTVMSKAQPDNCYKIWKTEASLVEPSPELGAWLENYWNLENED